MSEINKEFEYSAVGVDADGKEVKFGGTAETLQDAIGGVFGHEKVTILSWSAEQFAEYWEIYVHGLKGGKEASDTRYTLDEPEKSASYVAGLAIGYDQVLDARVVHKRVTRGHLETILKSRKEAWL